MITKVKITFITFTIVLFLSGCSTFLDMGKKAEVVASRKATLQIPVEPHNIVLMLPLKGEHSATSKAIRNGFLAAYYLARKQYPGIDIKIINTSGQDVQALYQQVVADGAEIVVGPLTKKEVRNVMGISSLPVPIIALNTLDDYMHNFAPNIYQFGLLPQDEAMQVATKMMQEQHDHVAIIAPENNWGRRVVTAFRAKYESSGGYVVATLNYKSMRDLSEKICPFLAQDASRLCAVKKHRGKQQHDLEEVMGRQDINAIFLVANVSEARQIVPLVKFYYAGDLPIYATSSVYTGNRLPNLDRDLDGIDFCDMPWVLRDPAVLNSDLQRIYKQITSSLWVESFLNHKRLYALGIDAFNLVLGLYGFLNAPRSGIDGATGTLYLDDYNHIYRDLTWAEMRDGVATPL